MGGEELGEVKRGKNIIRIYYVMEKSIFNKRRKKKKKLLTGKKMENIFISLSY